MGKKRWLSLLLVVSMAFFVMGLAAGADSGTESQFVAKINSERAANGLGSLQVDGGLVAYAREHTQDMIAEGRIFHSSEGELQAAAGSGWSKVGENVGRGQSVSSLHNAFMNSVGHCKNVLGDYNYVGVGTGSSGGYLYVTVIFLKKGNPGGAQHICEGAPSPTTTQAPAPTTTPSDSPATPSGSPGTKASPAPTTTTLPPTTTTTLIVPPDQPVTPGQSCLEANRYFQICHD